MALSGLIAAQAKTAKNKRLLSADAGRTLRISFALSWLQTAAMVMVFIGMGWMVDHFWLSSQVRSYFPFSSSRTVPSELITKVVMFGSLLIIFAAVILRYIVQSKGQMREENRIRTRLIKAVFQAGPARLAGEKTGNIVQIATESAEKMMLFRQGFAADVVASFTSPLLILALAAVFIDPLSAGILLLFVPLIPLLVVGFEKLYSKVSSSSRHARGQLASAYLDAISGLVTLRLLGAAGRVGKRLAELGEHNRQSIMRLLKGNQLVLFVIDMGFSLMIVTAATALSAWRMETGVISIGQAITLLGIAVLLLEPADQVGAFFYVGMGGMAGQRTIGAFLGKFEKPASQASATDQTGPADASEKKENIVSEASPAVIEIAGLSFAYGEKPVLNQVDLQVKAGEKVALIGPSGQGKSTLLSVIKGYLQPSDGTVKIGGKTDPQTRADASAYVSQHTWLFSGTVADNLRLANSHIDENTMWECLKRVRLDEEIRRLPQGLHTQVGEQGMSLSGGQCQRLSLARAFASNRKILLLDEPTSQVDLVSERLLLEAIGTLGDEYTLIMVTHRKTSLENMDRIYKVSAGRLSQVEAGDIDE